VEYLKQLRERIAEEKGIMIRKEAVMHDYIHLFVIAHQKFSLSQIVKISKGIKAKFIFEKFPDIRNRIRRGHLWNPGYCCGTMGDVTKDNILRYIVTQKVSNLLRT
jgi:putative transposase